MADNTFQEKIKKKHEERLASIEKRRQARIKEKTETNENSDAFLLSFTSEKREIVSHLNSLNENITNIELSSSFDLITKKMHTLQKFVSDSANYLPSYDIRRAQEILAKLRDDITERREKLLPKKKFAFKSRQKIKAKDENVDSIVKPEESSNFYNLENMPGFMNHSGETLKLLENDSSGKDLNLCNLEDCIIYIYGNPSAMRIKNVINTTIYCGPVSRAIFVDDCLDSEFHLACQQLRIHSTLSTKFYIHVTSKAIIEDCEDVGFGCYSWKYDTIDKHYNESCLKVLVNNWKDIDDFNWLKLDEQSPNWFSIN